MTTKHFIITLALALTLAFAATANADTITIADTVTHWEGWGTYHQNGEDTIGVPDFTTGTVTVENGNTLTGFSMDYTVNTNFSGFNQLTSGDLFINVDDDSTWDYVVHLTGRDGGTASVYAFNVDYTATDAYVLGTFDGGGYRQNHPASAIVDGLDAIAQVQWSGLIDASYDNTSGTVTISGLDVEFDVLTVAYTVSCANDVVMAGGMHATPIPAAAWLLGSGLFGLMGLRRRNVK